MSKRRKRPGEVVCRCGAYRFPHRFMGGDCNGGGWVFRHWEKNQWGSCRDCILYEQREAGETPPDDSLYLCQVVEGREAVRECPGLAEEIRFEGVRLYGVNKPPPKRAGWRR